MTTMSVSLERRPGRVGRYRRRGHTGGHTCRCRHAVSRWYRTARAGTNVSKGLARMIANCPHSFLLEGSTPGASTRKPAETRAFFVA
jgi:hypothetical protein